MNKLVVSLFGGCRFSLDGTPVALRNNKADALLAFLLVTSPRPHKRETLMTLLWPDTMRKSAQNNLRQTLHRIRQTIPAVSTQDNVSTVPLLFSTRQTVQIHPEASIVVDATQFSQINKTQTVESLTEAVQHYKGAFLNNFFVPDSNEFESWAATLRAQFQIQALNALDFLGQHHLQNGHYDLAQAFARQQLVIDSFRETAVCQLMTILAKSGQRIEALEAYETFRQLLADELGVDPSAETDHLFQRILNDELQADPSRFSDSPSATNTQEPAEETAVPISKPSETPFHAPLLSPYFVGREPELRQIQQQVQANKNQACRIAIVGMGGIGKTTFATHVAHQLRPQFEDGVLWTNNKTSDAFNSLELWARAYGYDFSGITDLSNKAIAVHDMLADKQLLVVLDNVDDAALARPLLPQGERSVTIITTRNLDIATALNATPIRLPELEPAVSQRLLREIVGADRVAASPDEAAAATQISHLLHHLPLAVEIAAKRLLARPRMRLADLARRLERMRNRLELVIGDQAVRTSFELSWEGLSSESKQIFAAMGLFAGRPFLPEAVAAMLDKDLFDTEDLLFTLSSLSLVAEEGTKRYRQHPLLADYAIEKLTLDPDEKRTQEVNLIGFYQTFVQEVGQDYKQLDPEWEQITAVIQLAHEREQWKSLIALTDVLTPAWNAGGRYTLARSAYRHAFTAAETIGDQEQQALILMRWGKASLDQNDYGSAEKQLTRSLHYYYNLEEEKGMVQTQYHLARLAIEKGDYAKATDWLNQCQMVFEVTGDSHGLGDVLYHQSWIAFADGARLDEANDLLDRAIQTYQIADDQVGIIESLRMKGDLLTQKGQHDEAETVLMSAVELSEQIQDKSQQATNLFSLTTIFLKQGKLQQAKASAEESLAMLRQTGAKRIEGLALRHLSTIYRRLGQFDKASAYIQQSLAIFQTLDLKLSQAWSYFVLAQLHQRLEHLDEAKFAKQQALELATQLNHQSLINQIQQELA